MLNKLFKRQSVQEANKETLNFGAVEYKPNFLIEEISMEEMQQLCLNNEVAIPKQPKQLKTMEYTSRGAEGIEAREISMEEWEEGYRQTLDK